MTDSFLVAKRRGARWLPLLLVCLLLQVPPAGTAARAEGLVAPSGPVVLTLAGAIGRTNAGAEAQFDRPMLLALPQRLVVTGTRWTDGVHRFEGPLLRDLLALVAAEGSRLELQALNDYVALMPVSDSETYGVILALTMDGEPLSRRDKGPIWVVYPRDQEAVPDTEIVNSRWVWQLSRIEVR